MERLATKSELCIPILINGKYQGMLNVESDVVNAFDQGDVVTLEAMRKVSELIKAVAGSDMAVLLRGDTGKG